MCTVPPCAAHYDLPAPLLHAYPILLLCRIAVGLYLLQFCLTFMFFRSAGRDDDEGRGDGKRGDKAAEPNVA